ncbi:hypothetical protein MRX96_027360 [Rhipicephalus microplus]
MIRLARRYSRGSAVPGRPLGRHDQRSRARENRRSSVRRHSFRPEESPEQKTGPFPPARPPAHAAASGKGSNPAKHRQRERRTRRDAVKPMRPCLLRLLYSSVSHCTAALSLTEIRSEELAGH